MVVVVVAAAQVRPAEARAAAAAEAFAQADPELATIPVIMSTAVPSLAPEHVTVLAKPLRLERLLAMVAELTRRS